MTVGWAILGSGYHAGLRLAPAIRRARESRLVAVLSRTRERAAEAAASFGAERGYSDLDELLRDREVDAVFIATPNSLHAPQAIKAARAGKQVLCEKPMALTVADAQAMIEACRAGGVLLGVGFQMRYHPAAQMARSMVAEGRLGPIALATAQWTVAGVTLDPASWWGDPGMVGGFSIMGCGVHALDLLRFVLGQEALRVSALSDGQRPQQPLDTFVTALLEFAGGTRAQMTCGINSYPYAHNDLVLYGQSGRLDAVDALWDEYRGRLEVVDVRGSALWHFSAQEPNSDLYMLEVEGFNRAIAAAREPLATGEDGLAMVRLTAAIMESAREGRAVVVPR